MPMPIRTATMLSLAATLASALTAADGPRLVEDIAPGQASLILLSGEAQGSRRTAAEANGLLFFIRRLPEAGRIGGLQAWRSDGRSVGTFAIGSADGRLLQSPVGARDRAFWLTHDAPGRTRWWAGDGSADGTREVASFPGATGTVATCGGLAYLICPPADAADDDARHHLWASDGNTAWDIGELPPGLSSTRLVASTDKLFFTCSLAGLRNQLWCFDPADQHFEQASFDYPFAAGRHVIQHIATAGALAFFSKATPDGDELWRSDGTAGGTFVLPAPGVLIRHADFDGRLLFVGSDPEHGEEPWISDGTPAGTMLIADLLPGPAGSRPDPLVVAKGQAFFITQTAADPADGRPRLWSSDGTAAGTRACLDQAPASPLSLEHATTVGRILYFAGRDPGHGAELWQCDGTPAGTRRISDINPGPADSDPWSIIEAGGRLFMHASDASHGRELWVHDVDRTPPALAITSPVRPTAVVTGDRCRFSGSARDAVGVTRLTITLRGATTGRFEVRYDPRPDEPAYWDLTLGIQPGITEAVIAAEDEAGNRCVLRRMLVARTAGTAGRAMHVGFLEPTPVASGRHRLDGPAFPGATVYALDDDGMPASRVDYRLSGGATRTGAADANDDGTWTIAGATLGAGASALEVTARDAQGASADARLDLEVPQAAPGSPAEGGRCGGGSGIAALALLAIAMGLRRRT